MPRFRAGGLCRRPAVLAALLMTMLVPAYAQQDTTPRQAEYAGGGANLCLTCHRAGGGLSGAGILETPHGISALPGSPMAAGSRQCESCHGPSAAHLGLAADGSRPPPTFSFGRDQSAAHRDSACIGCHEADTGIHWPASTHAFADVACTDCHQLHTPTDRVLTSQGEADVCLDCHQRERAELARRSAHPVRDGLLTCTDCHAPHGGAGPASLARPTLNESCHDCHADMRGPFLWEHAPVREDCTHCHVPHGSNHANLLLARTPWLCQQCHLAQFHPSTAASGAGVPPRGASSSMLGRDCMNCHTRVHGSNHPSGPGLTR